MDPREEESMEAWTGKLIARTDIHIGSLWALNKDSSNKSIVTSKYCFDYINIHMKIRLKSK